MDLELPDVLADLTDPVGQAKVLIAEADALADDKARIDARQVALNKVCVLLACEKMVTRRDDQTEVVARLFGFTKTKVKGIVNELMKLNTIEIKDGESRARLPRWVDANKLYTDNFIQKFDSENGDKMGIYFLSSSDVLVRLTNYVIKPLYFIKHPLNSRRLLEVSNEYTSHLVEMPNKGFTSQETFETTLVDRGAYYSESSFIKTHYKRIANFSLEKMPVVHELKTFGWQPEGFFAFTDKVVKNDEVFEYNDFGIVQVDGKYYLSPGIGKLNQDDREEDNVYENDLYLKYVESPISFKEWARLFCRVYGDDGKFGLAFIIATAFKDIVTRAAKFPHFYCYGPKGSGKSELMESIMWFFFSGKNADGKPIQAYNLNPGQGTIYSFFARLQRFRNCPMGFNEYDPNSIEFWKKGTIKGSYDGEGREVGSGESGKRKKTEIQKVQGTLIIAGQYADLTDDGAVLSRTIKNKFSLEHKKRLTHDDIKEWKQLKSFEEQGLSSLAAGLFKYRNHAQKEFKNEYWIQHKTLMDELRKRKKVVESRLINNYAVSLTIIKVMESQLDLPFTFEELFGVTLGRIADHAEMLKENNALNAFWKTVEVLFDENIIARPIHFKIRPEKSVTYRQDGVNDSKHFEKEKQVLYIRFNIIYDRYAKRFKEKTGRGAPDEDTITVYLQDQTYYLGLCPGTYFKDKTTSAYMVDYEMLQMAVGINLEKNDAEVVEEGEAADAAKDGKKPDLPF